MVNRKLTPKMKLAYCATRFQVLLECKTDRTTLRWVKNAVRNEAGHVNMREKLDSLPWYGSTRTHKIYWVKRFHRPKSFFSSLALTNVDFTRQITFLCHAITDVLPIGIVQDRSDLGSEKCWIWLLRPRSYSAKTQPRSPKIAHIFYRNI